MKPEQWRQVREVLDHAIQLAPAERVPYLNQSCGEDFGLRHEVESLLASHEKASSVFLESPPAQLMRDALEAALPQDRLGRRIGAYRIVEEIGRGGMGEVYRAVRADGQFDQQVAIKLVRTGFDTSFILERFRNERQILASLDHPNIARLLDGGTTDDGVPFLAMELIEGLRIDDYCNTHKLNLTQRLQLFRQVCPAVQYAHQRLVVHRDLKPSNILVTSEGVPKLLDFGIAKIVDPAASAEATMARPMTPQYASPEQVRGEVITTASDVYSLGVILYLLLTGRSPYRLRANTPHELSRAITETEPQRPSAVVLTAGNGGLEDRQAGQTPMPESAAAMPETNPAKLRRRLVGELDDILLMALRKEPERRYGSVQEFSDDLGRHLDGMPVNATKGSTAYRAGKFLRRHKGKVLAGALAAVALLIGAGLILREARIARAESIRAEARFNDVRKLANSLIFELHDSIRDLPGSTAARKLLVTRALEYLDSLAQQSKEDVSLQTELATAYERVGDVLGYPYAANLGDKTGALQSYRKALAIRQSVALAKPNDTQVQRQLVENFFRIANVLESAGDFQAALEPVRKSLPITEKLAANSTEPKIVDSHAGSYYFLAGLLLHTGDLPGALENYRHAATLRTAGLRVNPTSVSLNTHLAGDYAGMAIVTNRMGNIAQSIQLQDQAVSAMALVQRADPGNTSLKEFYAEAISSLGGFQLDHGDAAESLEANRRAHQIFLALSTADPMNHLAQTNVAFTNNSVGRSLLAMNQPAAAIQAFQEAITNLDALSPSTTKDRYIRSGLAGAYSGLGDAYLAWAKDAHTPARLRKRRVLQARAWFEKSSVLWQDKGRRGELESEELSSIQAASKSIAQCDAALRVSP